MLDQDTEETQPSIEQPEVFKTKAGATGTAGMAMAAPVFVSKFLKWLKLLYLIIT